MKIRIPLLMLGPYLRPFLEGCIVITGIISICLFVAASLAQSRRNCEGFTKAAKNILVMSIFLVAIFVFLWLLGMP